MNEDRMGNSRRTVRGAFLLVVVCAVVSAASEITAEERDPQQLRVMTYNIHHGEGVDGRIDMDRLAEVIRAADPDLVSLQEVDVGVERSRRLNIPAELAQRTGLHATFERNIDYQGGEYGNAILSRYDILESANLHYKMLRTNEQRGLLHVLVEVEGRQVVFASTHLDYRPDDEERISHCEEIESLHEQFADATLIVCGDFNDHPGGRLHRKLKTTFVDAWEVAGEGEGLTYSSTMPKSRIDYVFVSPSGSLITQQASVIESDASDHRPLIVTFRISANESH